MPCCPSALTADEITHVVSFRRHCWCVPPSPPLTCPFPARQTHVAASDPARLSPSKLLPPRVLLHNVRCVFLPFLYPRIANSWPTVRCVLRCAVLRIEEDILAFFERPDDKDFLLIGTLTTYHVRHAAEAAAPLSLLCLVSAPSDPTNPVGFRSALRWCFASLDARSQVRASCNERPC